MADVPAEVVAEVEAAVGAEAAAWLKAALAEFGDAPKPGRRRHEDEEPIPFAAPPPAAGA